jgi:ribose transport system permease protein
MSRLVETMKNKMNLIKYILDIKIIIFIIFIISVMSFIKPVFSGAGNIINILSNASIEGIIAIGMTFVIILREIDLSVGATMGLACVFAVYFQKYGIFYGVIAALLIGIIVGITNGFIITKLNLPSIGVTLAMSIILNGLILVLTKKQSISGENINFSVLAKYPVFGIPVIIIIFIVLSILFEVILLRSPFGRNIYACGGNIIASNNAGINVNKVKAIAFIMTGALCGISGFLMVAKYNSAGISIGTNTAFFIITAVMLGGTSLNGGEGRIFNTFQGMLFIGVIDSLLNFYNAGIGFRGIIVGSILIIIVIIDSIITKIKKYR